MGTPMTQFGGSFRFVQLAAVAELLAELRSTGRLCVAHAEWTGEIVVRGGQIVGARLGAEHGRAALEAIAVALPDAEFNFTDEPVDSASELLVSAAERAAYLERLGAEHLRVVKLIPSLGLVPRLRSESDGSSADTQVTIGAAALQLIPLLVFGHTIEHIARDRGLARTVRDVASLMDGGLVTLDRQPSISQPSAGDTPVGDTPLGDTPLADRPEPILPFSARPVAARISAAAAVRSVAVAPEESTQPSAAARQVPPRTSFGRYSTSSGVSAQPPAVIPPGVAARLSAAPRFAIEPLSPAPVVRFAGWRKAIVSFFLTDEPGA
jgi:hypothetical protein